MRRIKMRSLQTRLGAGLLISLIGLFALQWVIVNNAIRLLTEDYVVSHLKRDAEVLLGALQFNQNTAMTINPDRIDPIYHVPFSGHYYRITISQQFIRSRSLWDEDLGVPRLPSGKVQTLHLVGPGNQSLLTFLGGFSKQGKAVTIAVAENMSPVEADIQKFQFRYAWVSLAVLVLLILFQVFIVRAGLRPLDRVRKELRMLERGEIQQISGDVPTEVSPLVKEINHLVEVMGQRLNRSRNALGNLAHALKAPLTLLTQLTDRDEIARHKALRTKMIQYTGTVQELIDRELKRARLVGGSVPGQRFAADKETGFLTETLRRLYHDKNLDIQCTVPKGIVYSADREDMLELLGNLLDNACKWANHRVMLTFEKSSSLCFTIEDDGPGCPEALLEKLSERGVRLDEQKSGHGLGLAIVKDIVQHYGGEIRFDRSKRLGGFWVRVIIPQGSQ